MAIDPETMAAVSVYDSGMEAKVASLTAELESVKAELKTKSEEVEKFVDQVETQIKDSGKELEAARAKISTLSNELKEREEEVAMINTHLEAHTATSIRLRSRARGGKGRSGGGKEGAGGHESRLTRPVISSSTGAGIPLTELHSSISNVTRFYVHDHIIFTRL